MVHVNDVGRSFDFEPYQIRTLLLQMCGDQAPFEVLDRLSFVCGLAVLPISQTAEASVDHYAPMHGAFSSTPQKAGGLAKSPSAESQSDVRRMPKWCAAQAAVLSTLTNHCATAKMASSGHGYWMEHGSVVARVCAARS